MKINRPAWMHRLTAWKPFKSLLPIWMIILLTLAAWVVREILTLPNFMMIYVLAVLVVAIEQGTVVALFTAVASFLCINFFLVEPYYTFIIADPRELLDLIVFFVVATLGGQLAALARRQADEARQRAYEQEVLYRLTRAFNQLSTKEGVYEALNRTLKEDFSARQAYILPYEMESVSPDQTVYYLLLKAENEIYGTLCAAFLTMLTPPQVRLVNTCASQAAMALQRIGLAERAQKSQQFEEADRLKTALLHAVSHDLRTPITIIKTSASNMRTLADRLTAPERIELSETIEKEADHLDKLVGNLLDLSRLRAGAMVLNDELNSLEEVVGDVAARVWERTHQERIHIVFPDDMPLVNFDYGLMSQAVTNLVDNSLRYEPEGSQIELQGSVQDKTAFLRVINHGPTIQAEEREHIMEPFYHGYSGHVGLGLPIAKGIVEAHHGDIQVEDTPGGGATFVIELPLNSKKER